MNLNLTFYYYMLFSYLCLLKKNQTVPLNQFNLVIVLVFSLNLAVCRTANAYLASNAAYCIAGFRKGA